MSFTLTDKQKEVRAVFATAARYFLVYGGSRCISGDAILDGHSKTIAELARDGAPIDVVTSHGVQRVSAPFRKGAADLIKVETDCGKVIKVTPDHRFWDGLGWVKAKDLIEGDALAVRLSEPSLPASSSEHSLSGSRLDARRSMRKAGDCRGHYSSRLRQCDEQPRPVADRGLAYRASLLDELEHIPAYLQAAARELGIHTHLLHPLVAGYSHSDQVLSRLPKTGDFPLIGRASELLGRAVERTSEWFREILRTPDQARWLLRLPQCGQLTYRSSDAQCARSFDVPKCDTPLDGGYSLSRVSRITRSAKQDYYTLHVPGCAHYFANGVMHHNSGKTFFICYAILVRALKAPGSRHAIFRNDGVDAKQSIGNETIPKVVELAFPGLELKWRDKDGYFELPNKSQIWLAGLKDKERLDKVLGKEYATIYLNEASQIALDAFELVKSRLAQMVKDLKGRQLKQVLYVDLNPTTSAHWTYQMFVLGVDPADPSKRKIPDYDQNYRHITVNPVDNADNLSPEYIASLDNMSERQRRRFFEGVFTADDDNALWRRKWIKHDEPPELERIVVAIDPAISSEPGSNETGIVAAGVASQRGYVLEDESGVHRPEEWARKAISLYDTLDADCIVAEKNQGGEMVRATIQAAARGRVIPVKLVTATRGKHVRAEPIAAMYEQEKVRHAKTFSELEDQMCSVTSDFDRKAQGYSPDRMDALVWALTELFPKVVQRKKSVVAAPPPVNMAIARRR